MEGRLPETLMTLPQADEIPGVEGDADADLVPAGSTMQPWLVLLVNFGNLLGGCFTADITWPAIENNFPLEWMGSVCPESGRFKHGPVMDRKIMVVVPVEEILPGFGNNSIFS